VSGKFTAKKVYGVDGFAIWQQGLVNTSVLHILFCTRQKENLMNALYDGT